MCTLLNSTFKASIEKLGQVSSGVARERVSAQLSDAHNGEGGKIFQHETHLLYSFPRLFHALFIYHTTQNTNHLPTFLTTRPFHRIIFWK